MTLEHAPMTLHQQVYEFLRRTGKRPKKRLGQNFLIDRNALPCIAKAAELTKEDVVLEIGAGLGCLTAALGAAAKKVIGVEIDTDLYAELQKEFENHPRIALVQADILRLNLCAILNDFPRHQTKVVGNLPYNITTPILWKLLEHYKQIGMCVLMMQAEVAQRIVASPGGKDYGALSIGISYRSDAEIIRHFSPHQFYPVPLVNSSLLKLKILENPRVELANESLFFRIVRAAFQFRRKMLRNAILSSSISVSPRLLDKVFDKLGIDGQRRGETLDVGEFASLTNCINQELDDYSRN